MVLIALARTGHAIRDRVRGRRFTARINWLARHAELATAAGPRSTATSTTRSSTKVPFADHNAMLDPSCPDITGRVLEALSHYGYRVGQPPVDRAVAVHPVARRKTTGRWFGRWGVNYIYGTWQVLVGLAAVGFDMHGTGRAPSGALAEGRAERRRRLGRELPQLRRPVAGRRQGASTASQTAWALLGLLAAGEARDAPKCGPASST